MTIAAETITAIILCGGRGTRMGGRDKPLLEYRGRPGIARIVEALSGTVAGMLISANRNLARYRRYGEVIEDERTDLGPLAGIASCLKRCSTSYAFTCPGDAPKLDAAVISRLASALENAAADVAVAHDGRQRQYLHLLLRSDVGTGIDAYLEQGGRSVKGWLATLDTVDADCADLADSFADLDEPADFD